MMYQIYGVWFDDRDDQSYSNLLEEFDWLDEARIWFRCYTRHNLGGYDNVMLVDAQGKTLQSVWANEEEMV